MYNLLELLVTVLCAVFASSGFWAYLIARRDKKKAKAEKNNSQTEMIMGLGHDRIIYLCEKYIERGWITSEEYENINTWLYKPYVEMGGNGTAKRLMAIVDNLPVHVIDYTSDGKRIEQPAKQK